MENREIIVSPLSFHAPQVAQVPHGASIHEIVASLYPDLYVIVEVDGVPIPREKWGVVPSIDSHVLISVPLHGGGGGGKNPLRTLLTIAVIVAAVASQQYYLAAYGATVTTAGVTTYTAGSMAVSSLVAAGVMTAGMLLVNAIAPVKYGSSAVSAAQSYNDSDTYSIGASSNKEKPWGTVPVNLGIHKAYPPLGREILY